MMSLIILIFFWWFIILIWLVASVDTKSNGLFVQKNLLRSNVVQKSQSFGNANIPIEACSLPEGFASNGSDCDDTNIDRFPGNTEICDGLDNDCDELVDESAVTLGTVYYLDNDNDEYGNPNMSMMACSLPDGYVENSGDCDDEDNDNHGARFAFPQLDEKFRLIVFSCTSMVLLSVTPGPCDCLKDFVEMFH